MVVRFVSTRPPSVALAAEEVASAVAVATTLVVEVEGIAVVAMVCLLVIPTVCGADSTILEEVEVGMIKVAPAVVVVSKPKKLVIIDWG